MRQYGGSGGTVTGGVVGLGSNFLDHLGAHVLELVFQLDLAGNGDAILGDGRGTEGLVQYHVAAFRAQGHLDGVGQDVDAFQHFDAGFVAKLNFFSCHVLQSLNQFGKKGGGDYSSTIARMSVSDRISTSWPSSFSVFTP
ncbi:hypothetical protein D3C80_878630 [compost metagenome]